MTHAAWPIELHVAGRTHYTIWIPAEGKQPSAFLTADGGLVTAASPSALEAVLDSPASLTMLTDHRWEDLELPDSLVPVAVHGFDLDTLPKAFEAGQNRDSATIVADLLAIVTGLARAYDLPKTTALLQSLPKPAHFVAGHGNDLDLPLAKWRDAERILTDRWADAANEIAEITRPSTPGLRAAPEVPMDVEQAGTLVVNGATPFAKLIPGVDENFYKLVGMVVGNERTVLARVLHSSDRIAITALIQPIVIGREPTLADQQTFGLLLVCEDRIIVSISTGTYAAAPILVTLPIPSTGLRFGETRVNGTAARTPFLIQGHEHPLVMVDGPQREASGRIEGLARGALRARFVLPKRI